MTERAIETRRKVSARRTSLENGTMLGRVSDAATYSLSGLNVDISQLVIGLLVERPGKLLGSRPEAAAYASATFLRIPFQRHRHWRRHMREY